MILFNFSSVRVDWLIVGFPEGRNEVSWPGFSDDSGAMIPGR